jgi:hypothetical protein
MTNSFRAARAHFGNVLLSVLALTGLAACGADDGVASSTAADSTGTVSLVSPRVGMIDRDPVQSATGNSGTSTTTTSTTPPTNSTTPTPTPTNPTSGSGSGTVASTGSTTTQNPGIPPVKISNGAATLDWTPPTQNSDGTTLTNLAGYTVYYGTAPDKLTQSVKVTNPGLSAYTLSNLTPGVWYFVVTAYSSAGVESSRSGMVSTTI